MALQIQTLILRRDARILHYRCVAKTLELKTDTVVEITPCAQM